MAFPKQFHITFNFEADGFKNLNIHQWMVKLSVMFYTLYFLTFKEKVKSESHCEALGLECSPTNGHASTIIIWGVEGTNAACSASSPLAGHH